MILKPNVEKQDAGDFITKKEFISLKWHTILTRNVL